MAESGARQRLAAYLQAVQAEAEQCLVKLGRAADAWKVIKVRFGPALSFGGWKAVQEAALGPEYLIIRKPRRASEETPAYRKLRRIAREITRTEHIPVDPPTWNMETLASTPAPFPPVRAYVVAMERNPQLVAAYERQRQRTDGTAEETERWRLARVAATANAALQRLSDPWVQFTAGAFIEQQRMVEVLHHLLPRARREAVLRELAKRSEEFRRDMQRRGKKGGEAGAGTAKTFHTKLLQRLVRANPSSGFADVLAILQGEEVVEQLLGEEPALPMHYVTYDETHACLKYELQDDEKVSVPRAALIKAFGRIKSGKA